nr:YuzF family protein [Paenibacillus thiaminolyticus]
MHHKPYMHHKPIVVYPVDPCVVEALMCQIGNVVILETTRGRIDGCVLDVKQDHVLLEQRKKKFFVRIAEIVWIMPE